MKEDHAGSLLTSGKVITLSSPERLVYEYLQDCNTETGSIEEIADEIGMNMLQVRAAMFLLLHKGLIKSEEVIDQQYE